MAAVFVGGGGRHAPALWPLLLFVFALKAVPSTTAVLPSFYLEVAHIPEWQFSLVDAVQAAGSALGCVTRGACCQCPSSCSPPLCGPHTGHELLEAGVVVVCTYMYVCMCVCIHIVEGAGRGGALARVYGSSVGEGPGVPPTTGG